MAIKPSTCDDPTKAITYNECGELWEIPVNSLSDIKIPSRDHIYILPNNMKYVLDYNGTKLILIEGGGGDGQPTQVTNSDGYLNVNGSGTYNVAVNMNEQQLKNLIKEEIPEGNTITLTSNDGTVVLNKTGNDYDLSIDLNNIISDQRFVDAVINIMSNNINIASSDNSILVNRT